MKLISLKIENFKGVQRFEFNPNGASCIIKSRNGMGKTTIYDAFMWLLFGQNSSSESKIDIRSSSAPDEVEPVVTATVEVNGKEIELKKTYKAKFNKINGEYKESVTEAEINGVPKKAKEYEEYISDILNNKAFKLISSVRYFNEVLTWNERRAILFDVCKVKTDEELCSESPEFSDIKDGLNRYGSIDEMKKAIANERKNISKELNDLPLRIDEAFKGVTKCEDNKDSIVLEIDELNKKKIELDKKAKELLNTATSDLKKRRNELENELFNVESEFRKQSSEYQLKLQSRNEEIAKLNNRINALESIKQISESSIESLESKINELKQEYEKVNGEHEEISTICPTCGQELPGNIVADTRKRFEESKASNLKKIKSEAVECKMRIAKCNEKVVQCESEIKKIKQEIEDIKQIKIDGAPDLENYTSKKRDIESKIDKLTAEINESAESCGTEIDSINCEIVKLSSEISNKQLALMAIENSEKQLERIKGLKSRQAELSKKGAENQRISDLIDSFVKIKCDTVTSAVNEHFRYARFKLFEPNKTNDGIQNCCETCVEGAKRYNDINNANQILVGLDIVNTLSRHFDATAPLFIDNAEGLDSENLKKIIYAGTQIIALCVSDNPQLTVEKIGD